MFSPSGFIERMCYLCIANVPNKSEFMEYYYPFGEIVKRLVQQDRTPKQVFVLGVYASAVHARWKKGNKIICQALAVASEPRIFWEGNPEEAKEIIN